MSDLPPDGTSLPDTEIDELSRSLRRHVSARLGHADQADDVVQDAWLKLLSRPPEKRDRIPGWLRVVAERLMLESLRRRRSRQHREQAVARPEVEESAGGAASDTPDHALRLLAELRDPYREVVRLRYLDELEIAEIAARLGRSEATVRSQLKRGLDLLRVRLGVREEVPVEVRKRPRGMRALFAFLRPARRGSRSAPDPVVPVYVGACAAVLLSVLVFVVGSRPSGTAETPGDGRFASILDALGLERAGGRGASLLAADAKRGGGRLPLFPPELAAVAPPSAPEGTELRGQVRSRALDVPIEGARILAQDDPAGSAEVVAITDAEGRFSATRTRFPVWIGAEHEEHSGTRRLRVDRGFARSGGEVLLESLRAGQASGIVVDTSGTPVTGAEVEVRAPLAIARVRRGAQGLQELPAGTTRTRTDAEGRFRIALRDGGRGIFRVTDGRLGAHEFVVENALHELRFVLDGASRELAAAHAAGAMERVPSAALAQEQASGGRGTLRGRLSRAVEASPGAEIDLRLRCDVLAAAILATPGEDLAFEIGSLPAGRYELLVEGGGCHGAWTAAEFDLGPGEARELGTIVLPAPGGLSISTRSEGASALDLQLLALGRSGADLQIRLASGAPNLTVDREAGHFELQRVWPGDYLVGLHGQGLADAVTRARIGSGALEAVTLTLAPGSQVLLRTRFPRRLAPWERVDVWLHSPAGIERRELHDLGETMEAHRAATIGLSVTHDIRAIEIRTSGGLSGRVDLPPRTGARTKLEVVLR